MYFPLFLPLCGISKGNKGSFYLVVACYFIKKSGGAQTWNYINKKNIPFAPKIPAKITEKAYFLFLDMLKEELDGTGFNTEYIMRIRPKACASLSHIDNDILLRVLKEACKEAHDGAAVHDI